MLLSGGDDDASATHAKQCGGGLHAEVPGLGGDQVADLVGLEIPLHVLDGIEFGSVDRQPFDQDPSRGAGHVVLD